MDEDFRPTIHELTTKEWVLKRLMGQRYVDVTDHPGHAVENCTGLVFIPAAPVERFSSERPCFMPESPEQEGWLPIDQLFGCYSADEREITIFHEQISDYAPRIGVSAWVLERIVRIHEFAHGLVHLGTQPEEVQKLAVAGRQGSNTDWSAHVAIRTATFKQFDSATHELLAQAITWRTLDTDHLRTAFNTLMKMQPPIYRLRPDVLAGADRICWPALFAALRDPVALAIAMRNELTDQLADSFISAPQRAET